MMNNPWFRIAINKKEIENGVVEVKFEHPTQPGLIKGGWMERVKNEGGDLLGENWGERDAKALKASTETPKKEKKPALVLTNPDINRVIEFDELKAHKFKETGYWFVVDGEVYDGTGFLDEHPGGAQSIISAGGTDCTEEFQAIRPYPHI